MIPWFQGVSVWDATGLVVWGGLAYMAWDLGLSELTAGKKITSGRSAQVLLFTPLTIYCLARVLGCHL